MGRYSEITGHEDVLDSRVILDRAGELRDEKDHHDRERMMPWSAVDPAGASELDHLEELIEQLRHVGGDRPEDGQILVRENYLANYVKEFYEDTTDQDLLSQVRERLELPWQHVDWAAVAEDHRSDYTEVTFRDITYYVG